MLEHPATQSGRAVSLRIEKVIKPVET